MVFDEALTRTNNRQNRIENRDFVALDPEQTRVETELAIDGVDYQLMRSESVTRSETSFDLVESTTALACASQTVRLAVQLKREIGKLWDDIEKAPYKELFNASVPGLHVWRAVHTQRQIDRALETSRKRGGNYQTHPIATHGNRVIATLVFSDLPVTRFKDPTFDLEKVADEAHVTAMVDKSLAALSAEVQKLFPNAIIPTLFKNQKKCEIPYERVRKA